ncbi:MAG TPA: nickel pincer cofactor biosynthesis protein LarB [Thermomicrobiales bacterium]|jgi:NCAIR mutase (PurE)-related protein
MNERPFDAVRRVLHDISQKPTHGTTCSQAPATRLDPSRQARAGIPEIVYARSKPAPEVVASLAELATLTGRAIATRCPQATLSAVASELGNDFGVVVDEDARAVVVSVADSRPPVAGGRVAVITAGSSDAPIAAEATFIAREMGTAVFQIRDVGVAGLHRLVEPLERVIAHGVDAIVVVAGMDGALPSVVAGLVAVPVIGLPTSTGYGFGGDGTAALMSMLQSCAPGLVVVNIDNGVGAGATAALIANRVAAARDSAS